MSYVSLKIGNISKKYPALIGPPELFQYVSLFAIFRCLLQNYREDLIRDCSNKKDEDEILKAFNKQMTNKELRMYDFLKLRHKNLR